MTGLLCKKSESGIYQIMLRGINSHYIHSFVGCILPDLALQTYKAALRKATTEG
jgi:hypothetical protein